MRWIKIICVERLFLFFFIFFFQSRALTKTDQMSDIDPHRTGPALLRPTTSINTPDPQHIMRPSRINQAISAYTQVKGTFDFNKTPLTPAGCKVIVHNRRMERASWADRGTVGYFVDRAPQHYRNYKCYIPSTKGELPHAS